MIKKLEFHEGFDLDTIKKELGFYKNYDLDSLKEDDLLNNVDLAEGLAYFNMKLGKHPLAQNREVLKLEDGYIAMCFAYSSAGGNEWGMTEVAQDPEVLKMFREQVAYYLAAFSYENGWAQTPAAQDLEVLALYNGEVAQGLAWCSGTNGWADTPAAQKLEVLSLGNGEVARILAENSDVNGWALTPAAQDPEVLKLGDGGTIFELAQCSDKNGWGETKIAQDPEVLSFSEGKVKLWIEEYFFDYPWKENEKGGKKFVFGLYGGKVGELIGQGFKGESAISEASILS